MKEEKMCAYNITLREKAFRKWDKKTYPYPPITERGPIGQEMQKQKRCAWRAALKWVKTLPASGNSVFDEPMKHINIELEGR